jgi:hypothetical protein
VPTLFDETMDYLESNYLTLAQLAERTSLPAARIEQLVGSGLMPAHSHEATVTLTVFAPINGAHAAGETRTRYFHPDLIALAGDADALERELGIEGAALVVRDRHDAVVAETAGLAPGSEAHRSLADRAWGAWRDGTLGVCLKRFSTRDILHKLTATDRMKAALTGSGGEPIDTRDLKRTLSAYDAVTGPFGPHERAGSTRALVYEPALRLAATLTEPSPA